MTVLILAPHADDEVLAMGGTIARMASAGRRIVLAVLTGHGEAEHPLWPRSKWDVIRNECRAAGNILGVSEVIFRELPAACLDSVPAWKINQVVTELIVSSQPEELYIPFAHDLHKDHAAVAYAANVASRPYSKMAQSIRRVIAYETLSETHLAPPYLAPSFQPNVFVDISATIDKKIAAMCAYKSQLQEDHMPRSVAAIRSLAHLRGVHIGCAAAEGFLLLGEYLR